MRTEESEMDGSEPPPARCAVGLAALRPYQKAAAQPHTPSAQPAAAPSSRLPSTAQVLHPLSSQRTQAGQLPPITGAAAGTLISTGVRKLRKATKLWATNATALVCESVTWTIQDKLEHLKPKRYGGIFVQFCFSKKAGLLLSMT